MEEKKIHARRRKNTRKNGTRGNTSTTVVPCLPVENRAGPWHSQIYRA